MADSFFGFDASIPLDDDGGGGIEETEEDYDALNSETFGSAINGDWEDLHENLVRLDRSSDIKDDNGESDLELNLSRVGMDDFDVAKEDNEGRVQLDPSVWAHPLKAAIENSGPSNDSYGFYRNPDAFLRQHFPNPFSAPAAASSQSAMQPNPPTQILNQHHQQLVQQQQQQKQLQQQQNLQQQQINLHEITKAMPPPHKIMSVEDIERNIRNQQKQQNQSTSKSEAMARPQTPQHHRQLPNQLLQQFQRTPAPPPGLPPPKGPLFPPHHQMQVNGPKPAPRLPPGFPPLQLMGPHPIGGNGGPLPLHNNMPRPMPHNLPVALNNFAMHPNFNAMRPNIPPPRLPPHLVSPHFQPNMQNLQSTVNQFNQRLVQEIQLNHPMLPFNRMNNHFNNNMGNMQQQQHMNSNVQQQQHQLQLMNGGKHNNNNQIQNFRGNGNLNDDYDDYANMMSNRDKQWLISIQLAQLNTGTPYIDDYYYTVFKERKSQAKGERENKAHKSNQMHHPFSQPKGHAHLVLISMGNKNGTNHHHHQRNGQNNRERKNSESNKDKEQTPRTYTPLQFENSLGKLQCGSVTAPRKIIDMDVVGPESSSPFSTSIEISAQRKSRQLLMHIETLYRIVLKLEDLENPTAIATALIVKERKERERQMALELLHHQQQHLAITDGHAGLSLDSAGNSLRSSISSTEKEEEGRDELLAKLMAGLTVEKVAQMMTVRKGKTLLRRSLALIKDHRNRWDVWYGIFSTLPLLIKKDKDDVEGHLLALFPEFKKQMQNASMVEILKLSNSIKAFDRKLSYAFVNRFCISCIIALILRAESIYLVAFDSVQATMQSDWSTFLTLLANTASTNTQAQSLDAAIENDVLKSLVSHFTRFRELKSQQLLVVLTQEPF